MLINPADDEINIFLPVAFLLFVATILVISGITFSLLSVGLKRFNVIEGKILDRAFNFIAKKFYSK